MARIVDNRTVIVTIVAIRFIIFPWIFTKTGWLEATNTSSILERLGSSSVDRHVKEESYNIYEMSVSGGCFEAEVVFGCKVEQNLTH